MSQQSAWSHGASRVMQERFRKARYGALRAGKDYVVGHGRT
jgi:hypothetical protein